MIENLQDAEREIMDLQRRILELEDQLLKVTSSKERGKIGRRGSELEELVFVDKNAKSKRARFSLDLGASPAVVRIEEF